MDPMLEEASHTGDLDALRLLAQFSTTPPLFANNSLQSSQASEVRGADEIRGPDQPSQASEVRVPNQPSQSYSARAFHYCIELYHLIIRWSLRIISWLGLSPCDQNSQKEESTTPQTLMVVATIIATITFQPVLSPPGGLDLNGKATRGHELLKFLVCDMIGLFASLCIILLLICVRPGQKKRLMRILVWVIWIAVFSTTLAFTSAALIIFPSSDVVSYLVDLWNLVSQIIVLWVYYRLAIYLFYLVGWWEPLDTRTNHTAWVWIALTIERAIVICVAVVVPALCFHIIFYYFRIVSFPLWSCYLLTTWAVMMEFPLFYLSLRFTVYLIWRGNRLYVVRILTYLIWKWGRLYVARIVTDVLIAAAFYVLRDRLIAAAIYVLRFFIRLILIVAVILFVVIKIYSFQFLFRSYNICKI